MPTDDVRSRVARRLSNESAALSTSVFGRRARWVTGLATAGVKSLGRSVRRTLGVDRGDVEPEATVAASLGELKGPMMKLGQMLGYVEVGLPEGLRSALAALHTHAQPIGAAHIHHVLDEDLGDPGRDLARAMHPNALSAASIGQVHRSALPDGTPVAVKVLHPSVVTVIERDLWPAMMASKLSGALHTVVSDVRERLLEECDYTLEAQRQNRFRAIFAGHRTIVVPEVHAAFSSARVLTSTFVDGVHLDAYVASPALRPEARDRSGEALFDFYIAPLFRHGLYNSDPHPGNFLFMPDGRIAFVDFGSVREFPPAYVSGLAALMDALMSGDRSGMHEALATLGMRADVPYDRESTWRLLHAFFGPLLRDEVLAFEPNAELTRRELVTSAWKARRLASSGELLFFLRTFLGLSSVLARLGARANWRRRLASVVSTAMSRAHSLPGEATVSGRPAAAGPVPTDRGRPSSRRQEVSWDVVLVDPGPRPIALIRELRELMGRDLRELEALLDSIPETLRSGVQREDAETLRQRLAVVGARVEVRRASAPA
jgi:predicted unusual protein kinase regulating ubiquinone biosynthesis (AarF/ABC1/UbiB family)